MAKRFTQKELHDLLSTNDESAPVFFAENEFAGRPALMFVTEISSQPLSADNEVTAMLSSIQISIFAKSWKTFNRLKFFLADKLSARFVDSPTEDGEYYQSDATLQLLMEWER